jgi:hypothetical protein
VANESKVQANIDHAIQQAVLTIPALQDAADFTIDLILFCGREFGDPVTGLLMRHWRPLRNMQQDVHAHAYVKRAIKICQIEREMEKRHRAGHVCACRWSQWHGADGYDYKKHVVVSIKAKKIAAAKGVSAKCAARACICDCQPGVCSWLDMQAAAAVATTDAPASQGRHDQLLVSITRSIYHTHAHAHIHAHAYVHARAHARAYARVTQTAVGQMTGEQLQFLLLQFHSAGKLPAAAIQRSMEATSIEKHPESRLDQKKFTLPIRRVKSWVGYYKSMLKKVESNKGKFTKAVKAARVAVDLDSGDEPAGVEEAGGVEEEGTEEEEAELPPPAPTPRLGLEHVSEGTGGVMVSSDLVGRRTQYRFDGDQGSWWDEVLVAKQTGERQHFDLRGQSQGAEEWKCNGEVGQLELACADGHCALIPGVCAVYDDDGRAVGSAGVRQGRAVGVAKGGTEVRCARGVEESREAEE